MRNKNEEINLKPYQPTKTAIFLRYLIFIVFWLIALVAIVKSMGLEFDYKNFSFKTTGIIYVASSQEKVTAKVELENYRTKYKLPTTFDRLKSGYYKVNVSKKNYHTWKKQFLVESNQVSAWENILLIKEKIIPTLATEEEKALLAHFAGEPLDKTIAIKNNELYLNKKLVTRFSQDIKNAIWFPDGAHIVYQIDSAINIIESDGANNIKLVKLKNSDLSVFRLLNKGQELLYKDGQKILIAKLY